MWTIIKNIGAILAGVIVGGIVNMSIVSLGSHMIPLPDGADVSTMEGLRDSMKLFTPANFFCPFLAHALGTLVGAFVAGKLASSHAMALAFAVGAFFLAGGVAVSNMVGGPTWFIACDLIIAYLPMAFLGGRLAQGKQPAAQPEA